MLVVCVVKSVGVILVTAAYVRCVGAASPAPHVASMDSGAWRRAGLESQAAMPARTPLIAAMLVETRGARASRSVCAREAPPWTPSIQVPTASRVFRTPADSLIRRSAALPKPRDDPSGIVGGLHRGCRGCEGPPSEVDAHGWHAEKLHGVGGGWGRARVEEGEGEGVGAGECSLVTPSGSLSI